MNVKWLDDFLCLAECRSFTRASLVRHASQSGLTRRIQSLEHWVGARLVNRAVQPLQLTEAGERFLLHAAKLRTALLAARSIGAGAAVEQEGTVPLAVLEGQDRESCLHCSASTRCCACIKTTRVVGHVLGNRQRRAHG
jgi:DNA-binding transcriptional LysR family regulator